MPLIGASGSGKSSVVLAGLVPRLEELGWQVLEPLKPGFKPLAKLEELLRHNYFSEEEQLLDRCINIEDEAKYLPTLTGKNLIDAICEPAKRQGYEVTDELLNQILQDVKQEPGSLPLLEFALTQLWEKRDEEQHQLTLPGYEAIGGMVGALNRHADKVYQYRDYEKDSPEDKRAEAEKALIKRIFLKLLQIGNGEKDTRVRQPKAVILSLAGDNLEEQTN